MRTAAGLPAPTSSMSKAPPEPWFSNNPKTRGFVWFSPPKAHLRHGTGSSKPQALRQSGTDQRMISVRDKAAAPTHPDSPHLGHCFFGATWQSRITKELWAQNKRPSFPPFPQPKLLLATQLPQLCPLSTQLLASRNTL